MKKRLIIVISIIVLVGLIIFIKINYFYDKYKMPDGVYINTKDNNIEVYSNKKVSDLIDSNVDIIDGSYYLDSNTIGDNKYVINYKYNKKSYKYELDYKVIDSVAPIYLNVASSKTVLVGDDGDFCSSVNYADNYDNEPSCNIVGEYDSSKEGTYNLNYVISDSSGNENKHSLTVNVISKWPTSSNSTNTSTTTTTKTLFSDVLSNYKNDTNMIGIDISKWQGDVDFEALNNAGCEFVIIRMAVNTEPDETIDEDAYFRKNYEGAKNAGLKVGVYVYTSSTSVEKSKEQANWVINDLDGLSLDFPIVYDWENWSNFRDYDISIHTLNECFFAFHDIIESHGYDSILYGSKYYLNNMWIYNSYPVWLAHYVDHTNYDGNYILWQMCNDGVIDGINGAVDIDIYNK
ncbi:MAG TPA: GH25 family lysozyme [Bacilli bacterium]|nr:GH25 family lysozyme [Bacilli bacterium]HPZ23497.1 GH25 family lysozyme [Bacilli bacterium]HQC83940.1 GH25 family lysozyme [Bacilli bacterium]